MSGKLIAQLLLLGVLLLAGAASFLWLQARWEELQELRSYKAQAEDMNEASAAIADTLDGALSDQQAGRDSITAARAASDRAFQELKHENQTVADWASGRIPDELRRIDRARRLSLDGPENPGAGREGAQPADAR